MCSSKLSSGHNSSSDEMEQINGRAVLQPTCNRLERRHSMKKPAPAPAPVTTKKASVRICPISPKPITKSPKKQSHGVDIAKPKSLSPPGSIATARREQVANMQEIRKMKTAHYGRKTTSVSKQVSSFSDVGMEENKRCSFITTNSDPIYVAYHDEEWGVPVHDDKMLFEILVLTTAQVGSDWTSALKKRLLLRDAFEGFDAEMVASFREKKITSISHDYAMELCQVRGAVDNANQILKIKREFGSFSNYLWRFVNNKAMCTNYKTWQKVPVKTSKSEAISKDLVKRGLRFVGPAVILSFMQAVGLTNDHLLSCHRHIICSKLQ